MNFLGALTPIIIKAALDYKIDAEVLGALILQESGGNPWATRYEPAFYLKYISKLTRSTLPGFVPNPNQVSLMTEKKHRATSWGCCQVMGETAREHGYSEIYITRLLDPVVGITWGAKVLSSFITKENGSVTRGLLRYNGGGDSTYGVKVLSRIQNKEIEAFHF